MNNVRKEIRDLITINEKIQSALLSGDRITDDEALLIRQCASELLQKIAAPQQWTKRGQVVDGQTMSDGVGGSTVQS
jgi:hypothetical protein